MSPLSDLPWAARLALLTAAAGLLLVLVFSVAQAFNDPPSSFTGNPAIAEGYQDRARWFGAMANVGEALLTAALPVAIVALALAHATRR